MKIEIHVHHHQDEDKMMELLNIIIKEQKQMAKTQAEIAQELKDMKAQIDKINIEVQGKLDALIAAIAAMGNATPEVEAALEELRVAVQGVDDLNPDTPPIVPPEG